MIDKRGMLLAYSLVISILAVLIGSSFATAADTTTAGGALPEGCKKSYCADTVLDTDLGEECVPGIPSHDLDICSDGTIRTKNCGSNCKWEYEPTSCPVCGDTKKEGNEQCDWGTNNGVWISTSRSCSTGILPTQYTCAKDCSGLVYQDQCPVCGNNIYDQSTEQCDYGTGGAKAVKTTFLDCPTGDSTTYKLSQKWDCDNKCTYVNPQPAKCPGCSTAADCNDNDPCTIDSCTGSVCKHEPAPPDTVKVYNSQPPYQALEYCGSTVKKQDPCGNGVLDPGETCASCPADVKCGAGTACASVDGGTPQCVSFICSDPDPKNCEPVVPSSCAWTYSDWSACVNYVQTRTVVTKSPGCTSQPDQPLQRSCSISPCVPGSVKPGSYWCSYTICNQATELVCNSKGTAYDVTVAAKDGTCLKGCGASYTPCSSLGCGATNSQGTYCGDCQPVPSSTNDPCAGITDPDLSRACCVSKGFAWAKSGEAKPFSGFTSSGQWGCVGDDAGEYYRFRECEGAVCATDATDAAACSSINSCVLNSKCSTRLDKTVTEQPAIAQLVQGCQGKEDDNCKLLKGLDDAEKRASNAQSREDKRKIAKDEIAQKLAELKKRGVVQESGTAESAQEAGAAATGILLCLPR